ncbi:MAG: hypothetical protein J6L02_05685 [Bacteroidales bacterium]|nr:hypothetical protein [Bacteroidales bacterium]
MILKRLKEYLDYKGISISAFEKSVGMSNASFSKQLNTGKTIGADKLENILTKYFDLSADWLLRGEGEMIIPDKKDKKIIPLYDNETTIGGYNSIVAETNTPSQPSDWIDAGDWFPEATAAIRHYGDSMIEYPSGSILALKRVNDLRLIIGGRNYVIETTEYRITKKLYDDGGDVIMAYSSNTEVNPDGRLKHPPISIPKETIRHIDLVLGCVIKEYSNGAILIQK